MNKEHLKKNLVGCNVSGVFSGKAYTGVVVESILETKGWNHIVKLAKPITLTYNNPTQTKANNRMVCYHVNYSVNSDSNNQFNILG